jgi:hypothetical protein
MWTAPVNWSDKSFTTSCHPIKQRLAKSLRISLIFMAIYLVILPLTRWCIVA